MKKQKKLKKERVKAGPGKKGIVKIKSGITNGDLQRTARSRELISGKFSATRKDFGFVQVEDGGEEYFISGRDRQNAMDGDTVEIEPYKHSAGGNGKRKEARIINITQRGSSKVIGLFQKRNGFGFVIPDSERMPEDIYVHEKNFNSAKENDKVIVELTYYGDAHKKPEGRIIEVLGGIDDRGIDVLSIIREYEVSVDFPEKVLKQAKNVAKPVTQADIEFREDLRGLLTVTVDGEDSKDLDDAISLEQINDELHLGVHIADVANYVQEGSAIDREALKRGTSIYPVDRVVPMLPKLLSNGICSLNEGEDRLALSCIMVFDKTAQLVSYRIIESVINVAERLSYTQVQALFDKEEHGIGSKKSVSMLKLMRRLAAKLRKKREKRGAIDFDFKESKLVLDENDRAVDIRLRPRNEATGMIEEFMLAANETVAEHFCRAELPFVYRIHELPDEEKIAILSDMCRKLGYSFRMKKDSREISPKIIANLIKKVKNTPAEMIISKIALRSMQQARYSVECAGHFGLATEYYCHFTSPIRRYPDLQIHRIIRDSLHNKLNKERQSHYLDILPYVAGQSSLLERRAVDIERRSEKVKKAEYMEQHLGEVFEGSVSSVTSRGMFVELDNTVEGMVPVESIGNEYYEYDEGSMSLTGAVTGTTYTLGSKINVRVSRIDRQTGNIGFIPADA